MAFQPHWRRGGTGWYPIPCDGREVCLHCKGDLKKLHGLNKDGNGGLYHRDGHYWVMAGFIFGAGPWCLHCATKEAWEQKDYFQQSGSNEYSSQRWDLEATIRPQFPSIKEELKKL